MTDIITLPRSVVEQALQSMRLGIAMYPNGGTGALTIQAAIDELRAALESQKLVTTSQHTHEDIQIIGSLKILVLTPTIFLIAKVTEHTG